MRKNWRSKLTIDDRELTRKHKTSWSSIAYCQLSIALLLLLATCATKEIANDQNTYTCPMHPTVVSDKPGTCPVCGMNLVRKSRPGEEVKITEDLASRIKSPSEMVVATIKTIKGEYKKLPVTVEAQGIVTYDTRNIYTISARVSGRLEKVYLKYPFQPVAKGQKVAEIYSPELVTAQRELLFLIENDAENQNLIQGAKQKLTLLGATAPQIAEVIRRKEALNTFIIYSAYDGYVLAGNQQPPAGPMPSVSAVKTLRGDMSNGMSGSFTSSSATDQNATSSTDDGNMIREGNYATAGETLFKVVSSNTLRAELNIPSSQAGSIKKGSSIKLDFGDDNVKTATVDFIQPFFNEGQAFVTVRAYTKDIEHLHIGHLVNVVIKGDSVEGLWIPKEAVLDLGLEKIVLIKDRKVLKPKKVIAGIRIQNLIEIKQGLSSTDEIAANAQYLIDSESFIKLRN
jgi:Cu(I)/Ag(I) efflux system membrane fusion protein